MNNITAMIKDLSLLHLKQTQLNAAKDGGVYRRGTTVIYRNSLYRVKNILYFITLLFFLSCATPAPSPVEMDSHYYSVKNMIAKIGLDNLMRDQANIHLENVKKDRPFRSYVIDCAMRKMDREFYLNLMTPVFKQNFSEEDAEELSHLCTEPAGKKLKSYWLAYLDSSRELPHLMESDLKQIEKTIHLWALVKKSFNDLRDIAKNEVWKVIYDCQ